MMVYPIKIIPSYLEIWCVGWAYTWQYITHIITTGMVFQKTNLFYAPKWINTGGCFWKEKNK